jgi:alpha-ketoglutarate-dependent taurine dioxygenase
MLLARNPLLVPLGLYPTGDLGLFTYYTTRKRHVVRFFRTKPRKPQSPAQRRQRNLWRAIARQWSSLPAQTREAWRALAARAKLRVTAFNLYIAYYSTENPTWLTTLSTLTGTPLSDLT